MAQRAKAREEGGGSRSIVLKPARMRKMRWSVGILNGTGKGLKIRERG